MCVGVACLFATQNLIAPNLTSMAEEFALDKEARDLLLGARLPLAYSVFSIPGAMALGLLADCGSRRLLLLFVLLLGAGATLITAYVESYGGLFWLRVVSGTATNAAIPIAFSFLGDLYPPDDRALPSTLITAAMGLGILVGQVLAGVLGPRMGWRAPFVLTALPALAVGLLTCLYVHEPVRGQSEQAMADLMREGGRGHPAGPARKLDAGAFWRMLQVRTNILLILQAFPGSVPWGVLFAYLNDFLSQEKGLPVEQATLLVSLFGVGSAVGGIGGGLVGQCTYRRNKRLLPVVMAASTGLGVFPMLVLVNSTFVSTAYVVLFVIPCTFLAGVLANINGTNVRPLLLNVNVPESRGSAVSVTNLVANLGKGVGPSIANAWMERVGGSRQSAFNMTLSLWLLCGALVSLLSFTLVEDETRVQEEMCRSTWSGTGAGAEPALEPTRTGKDARGWKRHGYSDEVEVLGLLSEQGPREGGPSHEGPHHRVPTASNGVIQRLQYLLTEEGHGLARQGPHAKPSQPSVHSSYHHPSTLLTQPLAQGHHRDDGPAVLDSPPNSSLHHRASHVHPHENGGDGAGHGPAYV